MAMKPVSLVDSTHRIRWEVYKEQFDNCQFDDNIESPNYTIDINGEKSEWYLSIYPKGDGDKDQVNMYLVLASSDKIYKVRYNFGVETVAGYWPNDVVEKMYSRGSYDENKEFGQFGEGEYTGWGYPLCSTNEFVKHFVEDKVTVVTSFVVYVEGDKYRDHMEIADSFMDNMRSMSFLENLTDFTIISGDTSFPCHRVVLAVRSEYFEALFRNGPTKKELKVDESPDLVKAMLEFMSKGLITDDIDDKAMDLILMSDMYCLDLLTVACETSLVQNLTPDKAVETLITIDKVKHVSKVEHRQKVLTYIKKEADKVVKDKDWKKFVQTYPDLITEILLLKEKNTPEREK